MFENPPQPHEPFTPRNISASYLLFRCAVDSSRAPCRCGWISSFQKREYTTTTLCEECKSERASQTHSHEEKTSQQTTTCDIAFLLERRAHTARIRIQSRNQFDPQRIFFPLIFPQETRLVFLRKWRRMHRCSRRRPRERTITR